MLVFAVHVLFFMKTSPRCAERERDRDREDLRAAVKHEEGREPAERLGLTLTLRV